MGESPFFVCSRREFFPREFSPVPSGESFVESWREDGARRGYLWSLQGGRCVRCSREMLPLVWLFFMVRAVVVCGWSVQRTEALPSIRRPAADRGC